MTSTSKRFRVEVLGDEPLMPAIIRLAAEADITHYTLLPTLGGAGEHGRWRDDQLSGATAKVMLLAVTGEESCNHFIDKLSPLLESHRLLLLVSETQVIRGQRF